MPIWLPLEFCIFAKSLFFTCRLCDSGEVEDQAHFLINSHKLNCIRHKLFSHCLTLANHITYLSDHNKCTFLLCAKDNTSISLILQMYHLGQSILQELVQSSITLLLCSHIIAINSPKFCKLSVTSKPTLAEQPLISCCGHFNNH